MKRKMKSSLLFFSIISAILSSGGIKGEMIEEVESIETRQEQSEPKQQSKMQQLCSQAKKLITAPVDYVFGEESSMAKRAFYIAASAFTVMAISYKLGRCYADWANPATLPPSFKSPDSNLPAEDIKFLISQYEDLVEHYTNLMEEWQGHYYEKCCVWESKNPELVEGTRNYWSKEYHQSLQQGSFALTSDEISGLASVQNEMRSIGEQTREIGLKILKIDKKWRYDAPSNLPISIIWLDEEYHLGKRQKELMQDDNSLSLSQKINQWTVLIADLISSNTSYPSSQKEQLLYDSQEILHLLSLKRMDEAREGYTGAI